jgi:hypothetical protein
LDNFFVDCLLCFCLLFPTTSHCPDIVQTLRIHSLFLDRWTIAHTAAVKLQPCSNPTYTLPTHNSSCYVPRISYTRGNPRFHVSECMTYTLASYVHITALAPHDIEISLCECMFDTYLASWDTKTIWKWNRLSCHTLGVKSHTGELVHCADSIRNVG